jgi:hypothetical protein
MIRESQPSRLFGISASTKDKELVFGLTENLMSNIASPAIG